MSLQHLAFSSPLHPVSPASFLAVTVGKIQDIAVGKYMRQEIHGDT